MLEKKVVLKRMEEQDESLKEPILVLKECLYYILDDKEIHINEFLGNFAIKMVETFQERHQIEGSGGVVDSPTWTKIIEILQEFMDLKKQR